MQNIKEEIKDFIKNNFFVESIETLKDSDSLLDNGVIDSTGVLELVTFLEENYNITVEDDELVPENLDSIDNIALFVGKKNN